jgi:hypothetical protein
MMVVKMLKYCSADIWNDYGKGGRRGRDEDGRERTTS